MDRRRSNRWSAPPPRTRTAPTSPSTRTVGSTSCGPGRTGSGMPTEPIRSPRHRSIPGPGWIRPGRWGDRRSRSTPTVSPGSRSRSTPRGARRFGSPPWAATADGRQRSPPRARSARDAPSRNRPRSASRPPDRSLSSWMDRAESSRPPDRAVRRGPSKRSTQASPHPLPRSRSTRTEESTWPTTRPTPSTSPLRSIRGGSTRRWPMPNPRAARATSLKPRGSRPTTPVPRT